MSKRNTKAQNMTGTIPTESILITGESNLIQTKTVIWFVSGLSKRVTDASGDPAVS
jgi:hypothetical protein